MFGKYKISKLLSDLNKESEAIKDKTVEKNIQILTFLK